MLVEAIFFESRKAKLCHQLKKTTIRTLKRANQHFLLVNFWHMAIEETKNATFANLQIFKKWLIVIKILKELFFQIIKFRQNFNGFWILMFKIVM